MKSIVAFARQHARKTVLTLIGLFLLLIFLERLEEQEARLAQADQPLKPIAVEVVQVALGPITEWVVGEGPAEAVRKRYLQFESSGNVEYLLRDDNGTLLREGTPVRGPGSGERYGQLLARLDGRDPLAGVQQSEAGLVEADKGVEMEQAALAQARNELVDARADFERKRQLFEKDLLAKSDFERSKTRFDNAREGMGTARARLVAARSKVKSAVATLNRSRHDQEKYSIFAPFDGIVGRVNIKVGDYFDPENVDHASDARLLETAPVTIIDPREMEVTLNLPLHAGRRVRVGQRAVVVSGALDWFRGDGDEESSGTEGRVYSVSPQLDASRRAIRVKVRLQQADNAILDGMFTNCWIAVEQNPHALRIPISSLLFENDRPYVYVIENGVSIRRDIVTGLGDTAHMEVVKGLEQGEIVALAGRHQLSTGHPVRMVEVP